jgi:hypothetical protein
VIVPRFRGVVSEEGDTFYPHSRKAWLNHLSPLACEEVMVSVQPWRPITQDQRGYFRAVHVELYREFCGYATQKQAYEKLMESVFVLPGDPRPSLSDAQADGYFMSEAIERSGAFLVTDCGLVVPASGPKAVLRLEVATP